ncbi:MAG: hypothetical protein R3F56_15560 [Planctomycetota bacterium]
MAIASAPGQEGALAPTRIDELIEDLRDGSTAAAADPELRALGVLAVPRLAEVALGDANPDRILVTPYLRATPQVAALALRAALATVATTDDGTRDATRALALASDLVPFAADGARLCAPLLRAHPDEERLRQRCGFSLDTPMAQLAAALEGGELFQIEVALDLLGRGTPIDAGCAAAVRALDVHRRELLDQAKDARISSRLELTLGEALLAVATTDTELADACAEVAVLTTSMVRRLEMIARLGTLGAAAEPHIDMLCSGLYASDEASCHAAIDALAELGPHAAGAVADLEQRASLAADRRTRHLATLARARVAAPRDAASRFDVLFADLWHPTRWRRARADLLRLGETGAAFAFASMGREQPVDAQEMLVDLVHAFGPAAVSPARSALGAAAATAASEPGLRLAVDVLVEHEREAADRGSLDALLQALPSQLGLPLRERAASLRGSPRDLESLVGALGSGDPILIEHAARSLLRPNSQASTGASTRTVRAALERVLSHPGAGTQPDLARARRAAAMALAATANPPALAVDLVTRALPVGPRLELIQRVPGFGWPPEETADLLRPLLSDDQDDEVRRAAAEALAKVPRAAQLALHELRRAARTRQTRALARAIAKAQGGV